LFFKNISPPPSGQNQLAKEEIYKLIAQYSSDLIALTTFSIAPKFLYINPSFKTLGYNPDELIGKSSFDYIHGDDKSKLLPLIVKYLNMRAKNLLNPNKEVFAERLIYRFRDIDGVWHFIEGTINVLSNSFLIVSRDITERIHAGEALRKSEERYRELFEKSKDAILIIHNKQFIDCNAAAVKMLNYNSKEKFLNAHPSELSPKNQPDGQESLSKANEMIEIAQKKGSHRFEWYHRKSDGEIFPVEVLLTSISGNADNATLYTV